MGSCYRYVLLYSMIILLPDDIFVVCRAGYMDTTLLGVFAAAVFQFRSEALLQVLIFKFLIV